MADSLARVLLVAALLPGCVGGEVELIGPSIRLGPVPEEHVWSRGFGMNGADYARGVDVDAAGDVFLVATSPGADFGGGALPSGGGEPIGVVAKYDGDDGSHLWSRSIHGTGRASTWDVEVDADGRAIVLGHGYGELDFGEGPADFPEMVFVARYDAAGALDWLTTFTGGSVNEARIAEQDGRTYVAVYFSEAIVTDGATISSAGATDGALIALDAAGGVLWTRHFAGSGDDTTNSIAALDDGLAVVGHSGGAMDVGGATTLAEGAFVARLDSAGALLWAEVMESGPDAWGNDVVFHADGAVTGVGQSNLAGFASTETFLVHYDDSGAREWFVRPEFRSGGSSSRAAVTADDRIVVVGRANGLAGADPEILGLGVSLELRDRTGALVALRSYQPALYPGTTMAFDVAVSGDALVISGDQVGIDLGGGPLPNGGDEDVFVAKLRLAPSSSEL